MNNKYLRIFFLVFFLLLLVLGLVMVIIPKIQVYRQDSAINQSLADWKASVEQKTSDKSDPQDPEQEKLIYNELFQAMVLYNQDIFQNGQKNLVDAWSYESEVFDLTEYGVEEEAVGLISIEKIGIELPLYLGASYENLSKGYAQLSQTSMPIGGENTNCVVACHRGFNGSAFLRDADKLEIGDIVTMRNFWETLTYKVYQIEVIEPDDIEKILIQPGRDLLTIVTCTPFRVGSHRLLIFCERQTDNY